MQSLDEAGISCGLDGDVRIISPDAANAGRSACLEGKISLNVECNPLNGPRVEIIIRGLEEGKPLAKFSYAEKTHFTPEDLTEEIIEIRK